MQSLRHNLDGDRTLAVWHLDPADLWSTTDAGLEVRIKNHDDTLPEDHLYALRVSMPGIFRPTFTSMRLQDGWFTPAYDVHPKFPGLSTAVLVRVILDGTEM